LCENAVETGRRVQDRVPEKEKEMSGERNMSKEIDVSRDMNMSREMGMSLPPLKKK
jgi:hypothetical protein